jgi:HNH endonuclease
MKMLRDHAWFQHLPLSEQAELGAFILQAVEAFQAITAERQSGVRIDLANPFWGKIRISANCWEWGMSRRINGYGQLMVKAKDSKPQMAHRYAYELAIGPIPKELFVLHRCDNRLCVRPSHLYIGTKLENSRDAVMRGRLIGRKQGRRIWGEEKTNHKLSLADVALIREARKQGVPLKTLVERFHVHNSTVSRIANGKRWL